MLRFGAQIAKISNRRKYPLYSIQIYHILCKKNLYNLQIKILLNKCTTFYTWIKKFLNIHHDS